MFHVGDIVRKLREQKELDQRELAKLARMSTTTLSEIERGAGNQRRDTLERLAAALDTTIEDLYASVARLQSSSPPARTLDAEPLDENIEDYARLDIPVIGEGEASPNGLFWDTDGRPIAHAEEWMSRPSDVREKSAYAIVVRGDSMEPLLRRGFRLILSQVRPVQEGDIVYAQLKNGERLVKVAHKQRGGYVLESWNPAYAPRFVATDELSSIHKCVYVRTIT